MDILDARRAKAEARQVRQALDQFLDAAEDRVSGGAQAGLWQTHASEWRWRPAPWRRPLDQQGFAGRPAPWFFGADVSLHSDCPLGEIAARQIRNSHIESPAPYGLQVDVFGFQGKFLSLVLNLPADVCKGLSGHHLISMDMLVQAEQPGTIYARLNVRHGPNTEQITREVAWDQDRRTASFDLSGHAIDEGSVGRLWIDIFFESPALSSVTVRELTVSRRPRAAF